MVIKSLSISAKIASLISVLILLCTILAFVWVITGPRSLSAITPYVEKELNGVSSKFKVDIEESFIKWDGFQRAFSIYVTNVKLLNDTNEKIASFPKASFDFSIFNFIRGRILSSDLTLINPNIYIDLSKKALYVTPDGKGGIKQEVIKSLYGGILSNDINLPVNSIRIKDASLFLNNGSSELVWKIKEGYMRLEKEGAKSKLLSELDINFGNKETYFKSEIIAADANLMDVKIDFKDLPSYVLSDWLPNINSLKDFNMTVSGGVKFLLGKAGSISQMAFSIDDAKGKISVPNFLEHELSVKSLKSRGNFYNNFSSLAIDELEADFNGPKLKFNGNITNHGELPEITPEIIANIIFSDVAVDNVKKYWPKNLGLKSRKWVTTNIAGGIITKGEGQFKFTPEDLANLKNWLTQMKISPNTSLPMPIPKDSIKASLEIKKANVNYHPNFPPVTDVSADVRFTGQAMTATISKGETLNSKTTSATVQLPNMWQRPMPIDIDTGFKGRVQDAVHFLEIYKDKLPENKTLESIYQSTGKVDGRIKISLPIKKGLKYSDIDLNISAKFIDTTLPDFIKKRDIKNSDFKLTYDKKKLHAEGSGEIANKNLDIIFTKSFEEKTNFESKYQIKGNISAKYLQDLELAKIPFINNDFIIDIEVLEKNNARKIKGSADISQSHVSIPRIGFEKAAGIDGKITFSASHDLNTSIMVDGFDIKGDGFEAKGKMDIYAGEVNSIVLNYVRFAGNDFKATYKIGSEDFFLNIEGKGLDLSTASLKEVFNKTDHARKGLDIKADIKNLYMKNGHTITNFTANADCSSSLCNSVNAYGKLANDKFIVVSIKPIGDRSSLMVESDDAGAIIGALGISKHINSGRLTIESTFADVKDKSTARGVVRIRDFTAVKTPILGKLLTLASLKGIEDLLNQQGITFKKFEAPFEMAEGVIIVNDAKTSGASVGITSSGTINNKTGEIDLKGAIIPAYEVNKALGKIPLVGPLLIGKKDEGLIATNYRIKGPYEKAKITVNPLTILTPGFLRNIFDILPGK